MSRARLNRGAVMGLDLSLRRPAAVVIPDGWKIGSWRTLHVLSVDVPQPEPGFRAAYIRLIDIATRMIEFADAHAVRHAFVENYAFSRSSRSVTMLAELGGVVRVQMLNHLDLVVQPVTASSARKLLLGKVPQKGAKVAVQLALYAARAAFANDDLCDAFAVANFGLSELGLTALTLA